MQLDPDETYGESTLGETLRVGPEDQKVLGMCWRPGEDSLVFDVMPIRELANMWEPTKRNVVSIVGRFYDALGFLSPVIVRFKIFFQQLCSSKISWDQPLSTELAQQWKLLISQLLGSAPIAVPRRYTSHASSKIISRSLRGFCDASMQQGICTRGLSCLCHPFGYRCQLCSSKDPSVTSTTPDYIMP